MRSRKIYKSRDVIKDNILPGDLSRLPDDYFSKDNSRENGKVYKLQDADNISMLPGDLKRSPDEFFSENIKIKLNRDTLVFIDEAFLSKLSKHFGGGEYLKLEQELINLINFQTTKFISNDNLMLSTDNKLLTN